MKPRLYVAGAMSGMPGNNYAAFHDAAAKLRAAGFLIENPAENPAPPCGTWLAYMRMAVTQLARCDGVVMLPGWEQSRGARTEFALACDLGLQVLTLEQALQTEAA